MKKYRLTILLVLVVFIFGCAATQEKISRMTPLQKYDMYRTMFNDVIEYQYLPWAKAQPEETKVKLRSEVNPLIKDTEEALSLYGKSAKGEMPDQEARLEFFLRIKNRLYAMLFNYGLKVDESNAKGAEYDPGTITVTVYVYQYGYRYNCSANLPG